MTVAAPPLHSPGTDPARVRARDALVSRAPLLICIAYCFTIFFLKAFAHSVFGIPHIDGVDDFVPRALGLITISLFPALAILLALPITRPCIHQLPSDQQINAVRTFALYFSFAAMAYTILVRRTAAGDLYGNRLFIEHGVLAPISILISPFIFSTVIVLALSRTTRALPAVLLICGIWGIFFSKGFMLAYPLLIYWSIRGGKKLLSYLRLTVGLVVAISAVVLLGRLRAGSSVDEVFTQDGPRLLLTLFLSRIDQLDSLALTISQTHLAATVSLWDEIVKSFEYLLPRDLFLDKPLSFSMEMTKAFRPAVFATDAANNFTIFSQSYLIAGSLGPALSLIIFLLFFYSLALLQRLFFPTTIGFWAFNLSIVVPSFISLISAGLFRDYVLVQLIISFPGFWLFMHILRVSGR